MIAETDSMKSPDCAWYWFTKSQVKQVKASVVLFALSLVVTPILLFPSDVSAAGPGPRAAHSEFFNSRDLLLKNEFFDWEYVQWAWRNLRTLEELNSQPAAWDAYQAWEKASENRPLNESMQALKSHPQREGIKKAHDLQHLWEWWSKNMASRLRPAMGYSADWWGWGNWSEATCDFIKRTNFRDEAGRKTCDIPDWRPQDWIAKDEIAVKTYRQGQASN